MKKIFVLVTLVTVTYLSPAVAFSLPKPVKTITAARGAANVNELATIIFTAIQNNDFDQLPLYIPTDSELNKLKNQTSEDVQAVMENLSAEDLTTSLQESFETVIREGISKTINMSELTLSDVKTGTPDAKNKMLIPVTATLTTRTNQPLPLKFEALKINNRYFLFQRMQWQESN